MTTNELNELAGRIEAMGRVVLHLVAQLEDIGLLDGPAFTNGLRHSIVPPGEGDVLMNSALKTLVRVSTAIDEARHWRRFRSQLPGKQLSRKRA